MTRLLLLMSLACCLALKVSASPQGDARFIASQILLEEQVQEMRRSAAKVYVEHLQQLLNKYNVEIKDPERLASLVPNEITNITIDEFLNQSAQHYLEAFDAHQLMEIRDFYLTGVWQKLSKLSVEERQTKNVEETVLFPDWPGYDEAKIQGYLSPQEFRDFREFFNSETGKVFARKFFSLHFRIGAEAVFALFHVRAGEETLRSEFVLEALQTKGLFEFTNPIDRRNFISKIASEVQ